MDGQEPVDLGKGVGQAACAHHHRAAVRARLDPKHQVPVLEDGVCDLAATGPELRHAVLRLLRAYFPSCSAALDPERYNLANLFHEAVGDEPAGKVVVLASNGDRVTPFQANVPVVLDGVAVMPGEYMFADSSGAVVIPDGQIEEVLAEASKVEAEDAAFRDQIARER
jgi:hypothetical protein